MTMRSVGVLFVVLFAVVTSGKEPCKIGDTKRDECNICDCMAFKGGEVGWYCTQWPCHDPHNLFKRNIITEDGPKQYECEVGDTKTEKSLSCTCTRVDGKGGAEWTCYEQAQNEGNLCQEGDTKMEECHACKCINNEKEGGTKWICLQKPCMPKVHQDVNKYEEESLFCKLGTIERRPCHLCKCISSSRGIAWKCIKRQCLKNAFPSTESRAKRDTAVATDLINTPCALNDSFKLDCNTCYCKSDKTGYLCTDFSCAPEGSNSSLPINSTTVATTDSINVTDATVTLLENATDPSVSSSTNS